MKTTAKLAALTLTGLMATGLTAPFMDSAEATGSHGGSTINSTTNNTIINNDTTNVIKPNIANGGAGGKGGMGGAGGAGGAGGNGFGGQGGNTGPVNLSSINNFEKPLPMGTPGFGFVPPSGDCGTGFYGSVGAPYVGLGGGKASQDSECLMLRGATATLNAGVATGDKGLQAIGLRSMSQLYPKYEQATQDVTGNLTKDCAEKAASISAALLANPTMNCGKDGKITVKVPAPKP